MKHCRPWMLIACVAVLVLLVLLPRLGVNFAGASLFALLLMLACCVVPMLLMLSRGGEKQGGCCDSDRRSPPQGQDGEKKDRSQSGCH